MSEIKYDVNQVVGRLASKIANLEMQLAHSQAMNQAYEQELNEIRECQFDKQAEENLKAE